MAVTLHHPGRIMQLILRDDDGNDLIVLDVCGPGMGAQGICWLSGYSGLMHAPRTPVRESWAYQEGSTPSDFPRVDERIIDFRLATKGDTPLMWEQIDSLLWRVLGFKHDAILRVFSDMSGYRDLKIRLDRKPNDQMTFDPGFTNHMVWAITAVACDPWWYAPEITSTFTKGSGDGNGTLTLQNPADQECWVQYANGEIQVAETWTLPDGIAKYPTGHAKAGQNVTHTLPQLGVGKSFLVDTHPLEEMLQVMDDSQEWAKMRSEAFLYAIPPHTPSTQVPIKLVGGNAASTVTAFMKQRYDRPFGGELTV